MSGPLEGIRVIEIAALGPGPFAGMLLADMGADVVRVDRAEPASVGLGLDQSKDPRLRGRRSVAVNLKNPSGVEVVLRLVECADALMEGFRPGVAERLGIGPKDCLRRNPGLVYGRMTGWGQEGPLANRAGHDIDYIAVAGALRAMGDPDRPPPVPLNYLGDFGGGALYLTVGILSALLERQRSGRGQIIDAAMLDGAASLTAMFHGMIAQGAWSNERGTNMLDGAAPFYRCYATSDGGFMAVGAIEPQFHRELLERLGLDPDAWPQHDRAQWPEQIRRLSEIFARRTRREWTAVFEGSDACVAPVLDFAEAPDHPHVAARETFIDVGGMRQPAPSPRFSRTVSTVRAASPAPGDHTDELLAELGFDGDEMNSLRSTGAVA